jgi:spore coat protein U domain-containing protein, fimbrial subunit CupE1/2/3/6
MKGMMKKVALTMVFAAPMAVFSFAGTAHAIGTVSSRIGVSMSVQPACKLTVGTMNFGRMLAPGSMAGSGNVVVNCVNTTPYQVALDAGAHLSAGKRNLANGANLISYELYQDAAKTVVWGDSGLAGTYPAGTPLSGVGTGVNQTLTVYGSLTSGALQIPGGYRDNVSVSVTY